MTRTHSPPPRAAAASSAASSLALALLLLLPLLLCPAPSHAIGIELDEIGSQANATVASWLSLGVSAESGAIKALLLDRETQAATRALLAAAGRDAAQLVVNRTSANMNRLADDVHTTLRIVSVALILSMVLLSLLAALAVAAAAIYLLKPQPVRQHASASEREPAFLPGHSNSDLS